MKLLEFVNAIVIKKDTKGSHPLLQFAGALDAQSVKEFEEALKDCRKIF